MTGSKRKKNGHTGFWSHRGFITVLKCQRYDPRKESGMDGCFVMGGEKAIASDVAHSVPGKDDVTKPR